MICRRQRRRIPREKKSVVGLPEEFRKESVKNYPILFRCAKRSILPNKTETSEKRIRSFYGQNSTAQSHKMGWFFYWLFSKFFWQSDHRFLHSRGAVLWLGQNQNIMLDNFEIFQKVMAFQKMNTKDWHISDCYDITAILQ